MWDEKTECELAYIKTKYNKNEQKSGLEPTPVAPPMVLGDEPSLEKISISSTVSGIMHCKFGKKKFPIILW